MHEDGIEGKTKTMTINIRFWNIFMEEMIKMIPLTIHEDLEDWEKNSIEKVIRHKWTEMLDYC